MIALFILQPDHSSETTMLPRSTNCNSHITVSALLNVRIVSNHWKKCHFMLCNEIVKSFRVFNLLLYVELTFGVDNYHIYYICYIYYICMLGMVPHKTNRGKEALYLFRSFEGIPAPYDKMKRMVIPSALKVARMKPTRRVSLSTCHCRFTAGMWWSN